MEDRVDVTALRSQIFGEVVPWGFTKGKVGGSRPVGSPGKASHGPWAYPPPFEWPSTKNTFTFLHT